MEDLELYESLNSVNDINGFIDKFKGADGEDHRFELKGNDGKKPLNKEDKINLGKEICAFANTYGGILIYHAGGDTDLKPFIKDVVNFDSRIKDSLEPRVLGITSKYVGGYIVIYVPESLNKPHLSVKDRVHYMRNGTSSVKMPDITIRALVKSQVELVSDVKFYIRKMHNTKLSQYSIDFFIENESSIAGEKGKFYIHLFPNNKLNKEDFLEQMSPKNINADMVQSYTNNSIGIYPNLVLVSPKSFRDEILYPNDSQYFSALTGKMECSASKFVVRIERMFLNSIRRHKVLYIDCSDSKKTPKVLDSIDLSKNELHIIKELVTKMKS